MPGYEAVAQRAALRHNQTMNQTPAPLEISTPVVRFAPSPTGLIHIGNARTALLNWLFVKADPKAKSIGRFILRFDDTDAERSKREYADAILQDLQWLGIEPDGVVRQSERFVLYGAAVETLKGLDRLYPCYETPDELDRRRKRQIARGLPPVYDRAALTLSQEERAALEAEGRAPHWRFRLDHTTVKWTDLVRGASHVDTASLSDPVLVRADKTYLYTLPSVVDDIDLGVTHIIRGEDHVTNTAVQLQLFEVLGNTKPTFGHHNLLTTASGEGLSKRLGHLSLKSLAEDGIEPLAVAALAVLVGSSEAVRPVTTLQNLGGLISLENISRAPAKFDEAELESLNAKTLHALDYDKAQPRLVALDADGGEEFWAVVRGNLTRFKDVSAWFTVAFGEVEPMVEDADFLKQAASLLPLEPWTVQTWKTWTDAIKDATGLKGRALFMPLRLALTGLEHGPELAGLLPLIGMERAKSRLTV